MKIKEIGDGHINTTYLVDTGGDEEVVLQKLGKSFGRVPDIQDVTNFLDGKFDTVKILKDWRVVNYIRGKAIEPKDANAEQVKSAVDVVVQFHNVIQDFDKAEQLSGIHDTDRVPQMEEEYKRLDEMILPLRVVHGDLRFDNIMFEGNEAQTLIDLDTIHKSYIVWDIGNMLYSWCGGFIGKPDFDRISLIKKRYLSKVDFLEDAEREAIDYVASLFALEIHYRYKDYDYFSKLSKNYCDKRSKLAKEFYESFSSRFL